MQCLTRGPSTIESVCFQALICESDRSMDKYDATLMECPYDLRGLKAFSLSLCCRPSSHSDASSIDSIILVYCLCFDQ